MFKNRALKVSMIKDDPDTRDVVVGDHIDAVSEMIATNAKPIAVATMLVIAAKTLSEIAIHASKTYIK